MKDLQSLRWEIPGFYAEGTTLYVHLTGDVDPQSATMVIPRRSYGFWVDRNFIYFLNLTFRHYGQGVYGFGIYIRNGSDNLVQGNIFTLNRVGVSIKLESHRNVIQNNEFSDTIVSWPWDAVYDGTRLTGSGGVRIDPPNPDQGNVIGRGNIIRRNVFHDTFDGFGVCPNQKIGTTTNETDVYDNLVYNVGDDGMETDGLCSNVRIWGNTFHDSLTGISLAPARVGPTYAIRNLIYRTGRARGCPFNGQKGPCGGTAFKFQYEVVPGSGAMYLFHNTFDAVFPDNGFYISKPSSWPLLVSRNNIWSVTCNPISDSTGNPMDFDYDDLWTTGNCNMVIWNNIRYRTLEQFVTAIGQERHGLNVNPRFVDPSKGDYKLQSNSQLIDRGVVIPGINDDFSGRAPDIGAFEFQGK
jgi:parallel beta-helix repeat protein